MLRSVAETSKLETQVLNQLGRSIAPALKLSANSKLVEVGCGPGSRSFGCSIAKLHCTANFCRLGLYRTCAEAAATRRLQFHRHGPHAVNGRKREKAARSLHYRQLQAYAEFVARLIRALVYTAEARVANAESLPFEDGSFTHYYSNLCLVRPPS